MSIVAMESHCMKTILIHLVDKSDYNYYLITNHVANNSSNSS